MQIESLRIGTRGSDLALWQANWVKQRLEVLHPGIAVAVTIIKTTGDRVLDAPLSKIGDKGLFTREIENALLRGEIDLAVHSLKDLPTELPSGLQIGAITEREDPRDVFLPHPSNACRSLLDQPTGVTVATGSLRRKCQLKALRPDVHVVDVRGNLSTRLRKLDDSDWAGMLLARAGVIRLGWEARIGEIVPADLILPAVGQGALAIEIKEGDERALTAVAPLASTQTTSAVLAERSLLRRLEGGCQVPIGTYARIDTKKGIERLVMDAMVGSLDGARVVRGHAEGNASEAESLGRSLAETLLRDGADTILATIRGSTLNEHGA